MRPAETTGDVGAGGLEQPLSPLAVDAAALCSAPTVPDPGRGVVWHGCPPEASAEDERLPSAIRSDGQPLPLDEAAAPGCVRGRCVWASLRSGAAAATVVTAAARMRSVGLNMRASRLVVFPGPSLPSNINPGRQNPHLFIGIGHK